MPLTDAQKLDVLWKKLTYGLATTDAVNKHPVNESTLSPFRLPAQDLQLDTAEIPSVPPTASTGIVTVRIGANAVQCLPDPTVKGNRTWAAVADVNNGLVEANRLTEFISPRFGMAYQVKVYAGDPSIAGELIPATRRNQEWFFDYSAGILHFPNDLPQIGNNPIYVEGYLYAGRHGLAGFSQSYSLLLSYIESSLDTVTVPDGWSVVIDDAANCTFTVTHPAPKNPSWVSFFGQGPVAGTQYRMRLPTTFTEVLFDTNQPGRFQITNATPSATGAQSGTAAFCHILF